MAMRLGSTEHTFNDPEHVMLYLGESPGFLGTNWHYELSSFEWRALTDAGCCCSISERRRWSSSTSMWPASAALSDVLGPRLRTISVVCRVVDEPAVVVQVGGDQPSVCCTVAFGDLHEEAPDGVSVSRRYHRETSTVHQIQHGSQVGHGASCRIESDLTL